MALRRGSAGWRVTTLTAVALAWGCSAGAEGDDTAGYDPGSSMGGSYNGGVGAGGGLSASGGAVGTGGSGEPLPPEQEVSADFELPHAGENYVYAANPEADSIAVIDAETLAIHTLEAGDEPRFLQTLAGRDKAIVLNVGSHDATVVTTTAGTSTAETVSVQPGANAIAVAPDGRHAVVYFDARYRSGSAESGSFQDVAVLTLEPSAKSVSMTVGFQPSAVSFSSDGSRAFVVTESGVSILDFEQIDRSGPTIAPTVPLSQDVDAPALDVSITGDGAYALARDTNEVALRLVDLATKSSTVLDLTPFLPSDGGSAGAGGAATEEPVEPSDVQGEHGLITDVDLSPDGDFAIAVIRSTSTVLRIPLPAGFSDPTLVTATRIEDNLVGSVTLSGDGRYALLYTTAVDTAERVTVLDLENPSEPQTINVRKGVRAVAVAPDHRRALLIHKKLPGDPNVPGLPVEESIDYSYGYTVLDLESGFAKLQLTPVEVGPFTAVPDGSALFLLLNGGDTREVQRIKLANFGVESVPLGSPPVSVGAVPGSGKVFVGQEHPDGRLTFIDWLSLDVKSVTGFELNSKIRE